MATAKAKKAMPATTVLEFDTDAIKKRELEVAKESDAEILERLGERFEILTEMTKAVKSGDVRAMIVSGPPGVGKSFGVEEVLSKDGLSHVMKSSKVLCQYLDSMQSCTSLQTPRTLSCSMTATLCLWTSYHLTSLRVP